MSFLTLKSIYLEDIMEAESTGIGICGWILTLLSLVLVLVTVPFSLFVCFKVNLLISFFLFWGCPRYIYLTLLNTGFIYHIYFVCLSVSYKRQNGWTVWQLTWPREGLWLVKNYIFLRWFIDIQRCRQYPVCLK